MTDINKTIVANNLNEIFSEVSRIVEERDKFLAENAEVLERWQGLENEVNIKKFWANEKLDILIEKGSIVVSGGEFMQDEHIEMKVRKSGDEFASNTPNFSLDFFEKVRYNKGKN